MKFVSAHDLRRSCLERLRDAGVPMDIVTRVARHANSDTTEKYYAPGKVQSAAETLRAILDVPRSLSEKQVTYFANWYHQDCVNMVQIALLCG